MSRIERDWRLHPSIVILDAAAEQGYNAESLAASLGFAVDGDMVIGKEHAASLSMVLGATPEFWLEIQDNY